MEDGLLDNLRIGAIIQARMASTRLPGKVLMPLPFPKGETLIERIVNRLKSIELIDKVVLATSTDESNNQLSSLVESKGVAVFRGHEKDVLSRYGIISKDEKFDIVVRVTGDNLIIDGDCLKRTLEHHVKTKADYTKTTGLPLGMNFEILNGNSLVRISNAIDLDDFDKEHVTPYFRKNASFGCEELKFVISDKFKMLRTTIDYPSDLAFMSLLIGLKKQEFLDLPEVVRILGLYPWLREINQSMYQKGVFNSLKEELLKSIEVLSSLELEGSARLLRSHL